MAARFPSTALILAVAALLVVAATAQARIVPQKGIAGAKLGMKQERVLDKLGQPDRSRVRTSPIGGFKYVELKYGRTKISFDGILATSKVLNVTTKDRGERTKSGVGVGSTKRKVKKGVPGVTCAKEFGINHCYLGKFVGGEIVTDFVLKKKPGKRARVSRVGVGYVLD